MKKLTYSLASLAILAGMGFGLSALVENNNQAAAPELAPQTEEVIAMPDLFSSPVTSAKVYDELKAMPEIAKAPTNVQPKEIKSLDEITGSYYHVYKTLLSSSYDGGCAVNIKQHGTNPDSIIIENFWGVNNPPLTAKAKVDFATGKITIPSQYFFTHTTYGTVDLCPVTTAGKPDRKQQIEGFVGDDGKLYLTTWWCVAINSGTDKDKFLTANYDTEFERTNATMTYEQLTTNADKELVTRTVTYPVRAEQKSANVLTVKNFFNGGYTADIVLNRNRTGSIATQVVWANSNGVWQTIGNLVYEQDDTGALKLKSYSTSITTEVAAADNNRSITWKNWSVLTTGYFYGILKTGTLTLNEDIKYPELSVSDFEGEGTEANPYKITSRDHLILLADKVNEVTEYDWTTPPVKSVYARVFLGKHFSIENDIDMTGYRFDPIGNKWTNVFAGSVDGKNHKIIGLDVNTETAGCAGLFGICDTTTVLKNIILESPTVTTKGSYCGGLVGWNRGEIVNCHVNNGNVSNTNQVTAAPIAGIVRVIRDCTVTNSIANGSNGFVAGIAGEVDELAENCHAYGVKVLAASVGNGSPSGGAFGSLNKATAKNCSVSGTVDSYQSYSNMTLGGIAGICANGKIENCVFTGSIFGYGSDSSQSASGGVVGTLYGELINSYATGRVYGYSSRRSGGVTGYLRARTLPESAPSTVKNAFFAGSHFAETYNYNPETEAREVFGTIEANVPAPVIENVYFDKQLTNLKSKNYGATNAELTSASGPNGFPADAWEFKAGNYPVLKSLKGNTNSDMASSAVVLDANSTFKNMVKEATLNPLGSTQYLLYKDGKLGTEGHYSKIVGNKLMLEPIFGTDTLFVVNGYASTYHEIKVSYTGLDGAGTEDNPFLLKTKDDLIMLANATTVKQQYFPETYFKFANDIDLEYDEKFIGIATDPNVASNKFDGIIDGDGHYVHKMKIGNVVWQDGKSPEDDPDGLGTPKTGTGGSVAYQAFVGRLGEGGVVKNLNIAADCKIEGWATMGGVVGYLYGRVENCKNYADIKGYSCWIGGIIGQGLKDSVVKDCYNEGNIVTGYMNAGGIAGTTQGKIENCMNAGKIEAKMISRFQVPNTTTNEKINDAAGIAAGASGAYFKDLVNLGSIYAEGSQAGGIVSRLRKATGTALTGLNDLINAVSVGTVYANHISLKGAISGETSTEGTVENVYYDAQQMNYKAAQSNDFRGMYGVPTSALISGRAPKAEDAMAEGEQQNTFDPQLWNFEAGKYPVLAKFANEPAVVFYRSLMLKLPEGVTVNNLTKDGQLVGPSDVKWSLEKGDAFKVEGNTLKAPANITDFVYDVLIASNDKYERKFYIQASPSIPVTGQGTEKDPYLIKTAEDWNALADWMIPAKHTFAGEFVSIANDIDFANGTFKSIAGDGATYFEGTFDGGSHTVKGIKITATALYSGAFGMIGETGIVKNLTLEGTATSTQNYLGGWAGKLLGTLENCTNLIKVTSGTSKLYTGGFVALAEGPAKFINCVNKAVISGSGSNIAGIVSWANQGVTFTKCVNEGEINNTATGATTNTAGIVATCYPATFTECVNKADIVVAAKANASQIGGIVAYANAVTNAPAFVFTKCSNEGSVDAKNAIAGIVGMSNKTYNTVKLEMTDCVNTGDFIGNGSGNPIAGIVTYYMPGSKFINCRNEGTIIHKGNVYAAGIAGNYGVAAKEELPVLFENCVNNGEIRAEKNQGGGIVSVIYNFTTVKNCYNTADVYAPTMAGGICAGLTSVSGVMDGCWNTGNVNVDQSRAGGLIGYNNSKATVKNSWNSGNVVTASESQATSLTVGGLQIGGLAGSGASVFTNCYNLGLVKGAAQTGGLIGLPSKNNTSIENCYQAGKIEAPVDSCGHIVGIATINNGKTWTETNSVKNTYYVTDYITIDPKTRGEVGEGLTIKALAAKDMGEGWTSADNSSFPMLAIHAAHDAAKLHSATVVLADGDTYAQVTKEFTVGCPEGVTWTADNESLKFDGSRAYFAKDFKGDVVLTAKSGDMTKNILITCDAKTSALNDIDSDKVIVSEVYYNTAGIQVAKPEYKDGQVYVVVITYADGTTATVKKANK